MGPPEHTLTAAVTADLTQAQAHLEHALRVLERLPPLDPRTVATAAHALNNYLTITGGALELLQPALAVHPNPQVHTWLDGLRHATARMQQAVQRLLRGHAAPPAPLHWEAVPLPALVERVAQWYQRLAAPKGLTLEVRAAAAVPPVWTDRVVVAAVLDNLLSNAVKYSRPGGRITVEVLGEGASVCCTVQDAGPGVPAAEQARLFQPGVRLSPQPTGGEPSLGYGLAVAKELIEQVGGRLWCTSPPGQGACFAFRLPVAPAGAAPEAGP